MAPKCSADLFFFHTRHPSQFVSDVVAPQIVVVSHVTGCRSPLVTKPAMQRPTKTKVRRPAGLLLQTSGNSRILSTSPVPGAFKGFPCSLSPIPRRGKDNNVVTTPHQFSAAGSRECPTSPIFFPGVSRESFLALPFFAYRDRVQK